MKRLGPLGLFAIATVLGVAIVSMVSAQSAPDSYPASEQTCATATSGDLVGNAASDWAVMAAKVGAPSGQALANYQWPNASTSSAIGVGEALCYRPAPVLPTTTTTTTTVPPTTSTTTTTLPPTTTSTTTTSTTTTTTVPPTTQPPTTTVPPASGDFIEPFNGNDGLERFDRGVYHRDEGMVFHTEWPGDHDMDCGDPTTSSRTVHRNTDEWIYACRDHLMTSIGDTSGYSTGWFQPRQTFTDQTEVSWDANITNLLGRQWWEVAIVPADFESGVPTCPQCSVHPGLSPSPSGLPAYPAGSVVMNLRYTAHVGGADYDAALHVPKGQFDPEGYASKAIRRPFSIVDNGNGTVTFDWGGVRSATYAGSFPDEFVVVFKDHNYTPTKDGMPVGFSWHWDSIVIR